MSESAYDGPEWLQCGGKEQYATADLARKVANRRNRSKRFRHKGDRKILGAYRCRHCGHFHIGGLMRSL